MRDPRPVILPVEDGDDETIAEVMGVMERAFDPAFGEAWSCSQLCGSRELPGTTLLAGWDEGEVRGFALLRAVAGEAELMLLAVDPRHQRQGIGQALLAACIDQARTAQAQCVFLEVRDGNSAMGLYLANGFSAYQCRSGYYRGQNGHTHDAISLRRNLEP